MAGTQDWFAQNAPKNVPPPAAPKAASAPAKSGDWFAANAPKTPVADSSLDVLAPPSLQELSSSNPNHEGLYHMKDAQGHSYAVPFSSVEQAGDNWRNMFVDEKEAEQYEKDKKYQDGIHPASSLAAWGERKFPHLTPSDMQKPDMQAYDMVKEHPAVSRWVSNAGTDAIKTVTGFPEGVANSVRDASWTPAQYQQKKEAETATGTPIDAAHPLPKITGEQASDYTSGLTGGTIGMVALGEAGGLALDAVKGVPDTYRGVRDKTLRRWAGADSRATESLVNKTRTGNEATALKAEEEGRPEHEKKIKSIREKNELDKAEHDKKVEAIRKQNEEEQAAHDAALKKMSDDTSLRTKLSRKAIELKSRIFPKDAPSRLKIIQDGAKQYFNKQYDTLSRLTSKQRGDLTELSTLLDDAEKKIQGSDTNVAIFNDIRKRVNGEMSSQTPPPREEWDAMSPDEQVEWRKKKSNSGISYEDLRGYYRELGKLVGSDSTPGDVKTAAGFMRDGLEKMQGDLAEKASRRAKALHDSLSKEYKDYAQTMLDKSSPVTKMLNAKDADTALNTFEGMDPFQKSYALDLLKGTSEHSNWLRRAERLEGEESKKTPTPVEQRASTAVVDAQENLKKAKDYLANPNPERSPGWEEGARKAIARAEDELEKAKAEAERVAKMPRADPKQRLRNMKTYREETAQHVRDYLNTQDELDSLGTPKGPPKPPKITPEPEFEPKPEPEFSPPKPKTISEAALRIDKQRAINDFFDTLRRNRVKIGVSGVGTLGLAELLSHAMGFGGAGVELVGGSLAAASVFGPSIIMRMLKVPGVVESLKAITEADTEALAKLPAPERVGVEQNIISMTQVAKSEGYIKPSDPTPLAKYAKQDLPKAKAEAAKGKEEPKPETPPEEPPAAAAPEPPPTSPPTSAQPLPGMEQAVAEQHGAAEDFKTEAHKKEAESSLVTPKADISKATGEMERNSPLFRDSEASGQGGLFREGSAAKPEVELPKTVADLKKLDPRLGAWNLMFPEEKSMAAIFNWLREDLPATEKEQHARLNEIAEDRYKKVRKQIEELPDEITVYRAVSSPNAEGVNFAKPGDYWTTDSEQAQAHWGERNGHQKFIIEAKIPKSSIDVLRTLRARMRASTGFVEKEITLPPSTEVEGAKIQQPPPPAPRQSDVIPSRRLVDLKVDPKRFQYKLGGNKAGVTDALSDAKWDQGLADPIHIWEDPETDEEFVVNGHHRVDLAQKAGADRIDISKIDNKKWPTAADARRFGALKNIADGNGTSVDAAKFLREKGYTIDELRETGLSLKKGVAKEGVALSKLSDDLFDRVVDGNLDPKIGAAIGEATESPVDQEAILKDVQRREKQGRPVSAEQIRESARLIKQSPTYTSTTEDLFGNHEEEKNLFLEMGEVSEYIQKELADEKRMFGRIATKGASEQLAKGENVINAKKNAEISTRAAQLRELYLKRSAQAGPVHAALQEAAERLAEGGKPNEIKQDAFDEIREHLDDELGQTQP